MKQNMGSADKLIRFFIAVVIAVLLFTGSLTGTAAIIMGIVGVVMLATSLISFCPLYTLFSWSTYRRRS